MATRTTASLCLFAACMAGAGFYAYSVFATQGAGSLAQAPMNIQANIKPAFIMAVDDSGSMTFQTQFPSQDGEACWSDGAKSFFNNDGSLRKSTDPVSQCDYFYVAPGPRIGGSYYGIPPVDTFGFARSHEFNPSYFNPYVTYESWVAPDQSSYGDADKNDTLVDPRGSESVALFKNKSTGTFRLRKGMLLPKGSEFTIGRSSYDLKSDLEWNGTHNASFQFRPGVFYLTYTGDTDPLPAGYANGHRNRVRNACGNNCDMWRYEPTTNEARQNFANWFSYYGNRNRAMIAGMTLAMADIRDMRVGYLTINGSKPGQLPMRDLTDQSDKTLLYTSMLELGANGGTPNRQAVDYIGSQFMRTDTGAPVQSQCQKNSGMLFTDGYSNGGGPSAPAIAGLGVPFDPTPANSMAAIATKYYQTPLRTGVGFELGKVRTLELCDTLPVGSIERKRLDCNANLHMNFFGITLGARGNLFDPEVEKDPFTDSTVYGNWPGRQDNDPSTVDDIWHAAVNTRGEYINARSPVDITSAMRRVLASAGGGTTPSGSLGLTGARIGDGSFTVTPSYTARNESTDWYSNLLANSVTSNVLTGEATFTKLWEVTDPGKIPAAASRKIFRSKNRASGVNPDVKPFTADNLALDDFCVLDDPLTRCTRSSPTNGISGASSRLKLSLDEIVGYLRGDQSMEVKNGGKLRDRGTRLGDIVNSTPVVLSPYLDHEYRAVRTTSGGSVSYPFVTSYKAFLDQKKAADKPVVFAGANDGMLHAFDGKTGSELFGYVPATALGHMGNLLFPFAAADKQNQVFSHTYFVDGPVAVSDAVIGSSWKTVVVGTAGAGGRGVFGLDVTSPGSFGPADVLWEINDGVADSGIKGDIGYVLGKPVIVPVKNGDTISWKAIFGNGYNSVRNDAVLFVVDMGTGAVTRIKAEEAARGAIANGLGNIIVLDRWIGDKKGASESSGGDGLADTVYAADQNGAVWKFDLRDNSVPTEPLFIATDANTGGERQPILGGIDAAAGPGGAVMLYFGTGSFSFDGDKTDTQLQTMYGVLDRGVSVSRSDLLKQTITEIGGNRSLTESPIGAEPGWYIDLAVGSIRKGERVVGYNRVESGAVFFTTYEPQSTTDCAGDGFNRLYGVYTLSGGSGMSSVKFGSPTGTSPAASANGFKLETGGSAPVKDVAVLSTPRLQPLPSTATPDEQAAALAAKCSMIIQVAGAPPMYMPRQCGRQSWRQVR